MGLLPRVLLEGVLLFAWCVRVGFLLFLTQPSDPVSAYLLGVPIFSNPVLQAARLLRLTRKKKTTRPKVRHFRPGLKCLSSVRESETRVTRS